MKTILIVDDQTTDRELAGKVAREAGHHVEYAADGEEGFTKAKALRPALILLDVVMPKQDGFATCRRLKKDDDTKAIPVVLVTTKGSETDKFWGEKQGCDGFVVKPYAPEDLLKAIRKLA